MRKRLLNILLGGFLSCLPILNASAALNHAEEFYLDNGLQVIVIPNHKAPIVKQIIMYKAGRIDEPVGKGGIAHFLEHLMFRGTHKFADGQFEKLIEANGGISNAATSHDYTYYYQFLSIDRLELAMYLEADRMTGLKISDKAFAKEQEVVFQERQQRLNANPSNEFWEKYNRYLWNGALYGEPVSGTSEEIKNITKQDVMDFYHKYYAPNNAVLILSGDIDVETAKELTQKYYGKIKSREIGEKATFPKIGDELVDSESEISSHRQDVNVLRMVGSYIFPHYQEDDISLYSLAVLSEYLSGSVTSPIYQKAIEKEHLAISAGTDFDYLNRENSVFMSYAYFQEPKNLPKIKKILTATINETIEKLTEQDIKKVKERMLAGMTYAYDNPSDAADIALKWVGAGYGLQELKKYEENVDRVTLQHILQVAAQLKRSHPVWGVLMPLSEGAHEH